QRQRQARHINSFDAAGARRSPSAESIVDLSFPIHIAPLVFAHSPSASDRNSVSKFLPLVSDTPKPMSNLLFSPQAEPDAGVARAPAATNYYPLDYPIG